jgi:hypothetical protein
VIPVSEKCVEGGLSDAESESECAIESDHNPECAEEEQQNQEVTHRRFSLKERF